MNREECEAWMYEQFVKHGLNYDWVFMWENKKGRMGVCKGNIKFIQINENLIGFDEEFKETALHEIAHAIAGVQAGHGWKWKTECVRLGIDPHRTGKVPYIIDYKYDLYCPGCNKIIGGCHRLRTRNYKCRKCNSLIQIKLHGGKKDV